jgi:hypothetical protein
VVCGLPGALQEFFAHPGCAESQRRVIAARATRRPPDSMAAAIFSFRCTFVNSDTGAAIADRWNWNVWTCGGCGEGFATPPDRDPKICTACGSGFSEHRR